MQSYDIQSEVLFIYFLNEAVVWKMYTSREVFDEKHFKKLIQV